MGKNIIKELFIVALLIIVIMFVIVLLLYGYVPTEKSIAEPIEYMADSSVTAVLKEISNDDGSYVIGDEESSLLKSYSIEKSDLKNYESKNAFESGKVDPFADLEEPDTNTVNTNETTNSTTTNTVTNTVTNTTSNAASTANTNAGTFFEKGNSK